MGLQVFLCACSIVAVVLQSSIESVAIAVSLQVLVLGWFLSSIAIVVYQSVRPSPLYQIAERCGDWCQTTHSARAQTDSKPVSITRSDRRPAVTK